jgi:hypothetical protein
LTGNILNHYLVKKISNSFFLKAFLFALVYGVIFYIIQFFLSKIGIFIQPTENNINVWDVGFYNSIQANGYDASGDNTGFFILLPLIWKITHVGIWGMVALNIIFFAAGFAFVAQTLQEPDKKLWLFWLTLPSVYFAFIPYTEAIFFLLGSMVLYSIKEKKNGLLWISLFLISLIRATGVFLLPAFFAMELLSRPAKEWFSGVMKVLYKYAVPMVAGLAVFVFWQYHETGIWFAYFKKQAEHWGHTFSLPGIPFSNIENADWRYHWLSALAMLVDTVAFGFLIRQAILWLKNKNIKDETLILSAGYLTMALMTLLFLNPKYGGHTTNIMGANRYTIITPFFFLFIRYLSQQQFTRKNITYFFLFINAFWLLFGAYHDLDRFLTIGLIDDLLIVGFMLYFSKDAHKYSWILLGIIAFNFLIQLHYFQQFISLKYMD